MRFNIQREYLLKPLQQVAHSLGNRPILPILNNLLLQATKEQLLLTGTDLEMEIVARITLSTIHELGAITVSARKFFDICRSLPEKVEITIMSEGQQMLIISGRSRYLLATLPAFDFPNISDTPSIVEFTISQSILKRLIESIQFSMAYQDVRYYLNGMLFEITGQELRTVATDGHRLALCTMLIIDTLPSCSVIVPRKGVIELLRILNVTENLVTLRIGSNNIRVSIGNYVFTSKIIDGHFPDYRRVLPKNPDKILIAPCNLLKQACMRVAILSNEKFRSVKMYLSKNQLKITANNSEQEEAEETLDVIYQGNDIKIGFNVTYVLDVLNILKCEEVRLLLTDELSSVQFEDNTSQIATTYIIMPILL